MQQQCNIKILTNSSYMNPIVHHNATLYDNIHQHTYNILIHINTSLIIDFITTLCPNSPNNIKQSQPSETTRKIKSTSLNRSIVVVTP